jgi:hypothetical protein
MTYKLCPVYFKKIRKREEKDVKVFYELFRISGARAAD